jgi:hypothetical protein
VSVDDGKQRVAHALPSIPRAKRRAPRRALGIDRSARPPTCCPVTTAGAQGATRYTPKRHISDIELSGRDEELQHIDKTAQESAYTTLDPPDQSANKGPINHRLGPHRRSSRLTQFPETALDEGIFRLLRSHQHDFLALSELCRIHQHLARPTINISAAHHVAHQSHAIALLRL